MLDTRHHCKTNVYGMSRLMILKHT